MIGYIFETTCLENGKKFIGKKLSVKFDNRYLGDNEALRTDIAMYGPDAFVCKMLMPYETEKALNAAEQMYIEQGTNLYNKVEDKPKRGRKKKVDE